MCVCNILVHHCQVYYSGPWTNLSTQDLQLTFPECLFKNDPQVNPTHVQNIQIIFINNNLLLAYNLYIYSPELAYIFLMIENSYLLYIHNNYVCGMKIYVDIVIIYCRHVHATVWFFRSHVLSLIQWVWSRHLTLFRITMAVLL